MATLHNITLSNTQIKYLRSLAHNLSPIVATGGKGLTQAVIDEIHVALNAHELLKIKLGTDDREERAAFTRLICEHTDAMPVQQIGKVLVIYKPFSKKSQKQSDIHLPK